MQRNIITSLIAALCCLTATGQQFQEEHTFQNRVSYHQVTESQGYFIRASGKTAYIYDENYTLYEEVTLPNFNHYEATNASKLSKKLFGQDDQLEFVVTYYDTVDREYQQIIMKENGQKLKQVLGNYSRVINVSGDYKLQVNHDQQTIIINLPGEKLVSAPKPEGGNAGTSQVYPNPAGQSATISYDLQPGQTGQVVIYNASGQRVERHRIGPDFNKVRLDVSGYRAGTYFYEVRAGGDVSKGKFLVQ